MSARKRSAPQQPKVQWRTIAVTGANAAEYARSLESALQQLTNEGYNIINQHTRGKATVITGQRTEAPEAPETPDGPPVEMMPILAMMPPQIRRMIVGRANVRPPPPPKRSEEFLYHFQEQGQMKQVIGPTMVDILRLVKDHLAREGDVLPVSITVVSTLRFEPLAIPVLLRQHAAELSLPRLTE